MRAGGLLIAVLMVLPVGVWVLGSDGPGDGAPLRAPEVPRRPDPAPVFESLADGPNTTHEALAPAEANVDPRPPAGFLSEWDDVEELAAEIERLKSIIRRVERKNHDFQEMLRDILLREAVTHEVRVAIPLEDRYLIEGTLRGLEVARRDRFWGWLHTLREGAEEAGVQDSLTLLTFDRLERLKRVFEEYQPRVSAAAKIKHQEFEKCRQPDHSWVRSNAYQTARNQFVRLDDEMDTSLLILLPPALHTVIR